MCVSTLMDVTPGTLKSKPPVSAKGEGKPAEEMKRSGNGFSGTKKRGRAGALYGVAGKIPDKSVVERLVVGFLDTLYKA